jgi:hypothetical protein
MIHPDNSCQRELQRAIANVAQAQACRGDSGAVETWLKNAVNHIHKARALEAEGSIPVLSDAVEDYGSILSAIETLEVALHREALPWYEQLGYSAYFPNDYDDLEPEH